MTCEVEWKLTWKSFSRREQRGLIETIYDFFSQSYVHLNIIIQKKELHLLCVCTRICSFWLCTSEQCSNDHNSAKKNRRDLGQSALFPSRKVLSNELSLDCICYLKLSGTLLPPPLRNVKVDVFEIRW